MPLKIAPVQRVATNMRLALSQARDRAAMQQNPTRWTRMGVASISNAERAGSGLVQWR